MWEPGDFEKVLFVLVIHLPGQQHPAKAHKLPSVPEDGDD